MKVGNNLRKTLTAAVFGLFLSSIGAAGVVSCGGGSGGGGGNPNPNLNFGAVATTYANIVLASYEDNLALAETLRTALQDFVNAPSDTTLAAAKQAWLNAREFYGQTEAYRFYSGPIDDDDGPEGSLNAWPLDECFIDYGDVAGGCDSTKPNIINDAATYPDLSKEALAALNEQGGDTNISTGFHAIEFLLWGQDLDAGSGAGNRPFTDYLTVGGTASNQDRRGQYLLAVADLLIENLQQMIDEWGTGAAGNYRAAFLAVDPKEAVRRMLVGIGSLSGGELGGERMSVAYNTKDKEDEHSCFSDNTHRDFIANEKGIQNVYFGRYVRPGGTVVEGPGLEELLASQNATLDQQVKSQFTTVDAALQAINLNKPFDQQILGDDSSPGRTRVLAAINALQAQTGLIGQTAAALDIDINLDLDGE